MKTFLTLPALLLCFSAPAQSHMGLQHRDKSPDAALQRPAQTPDLVASLPAVHHTLAAVTIHKNRHPDLSAALPAEEWRDHRPMHPTAAHSQPGVQAIPIGGGSCLLVSGGYFMEERKEQTGHQGLARTWPIGNELIGIVLRSNGPDRTIRP